MFLHQIEGSCVVELLGASGGGDGGSGNGHGSRRRLFYRRSRAVSGRVQGEERGKNEKTGRHIGLVLTCTPGMNDKFYGY